MLRRCAAFLALALLFAAALVPLSATDPFSSVSEGEVLFASRYADYASLRDTGVYFGTLSWSGASAALRDGELIVSTDDRKSYLLLPATDSWPDTYTVRYSFRFTDITAPNAYCAFLLTSWGDAPSNRTELTVRAAGSVDGFGACSDALAAAIADGQTLTVTVPILHGMLHEVTLAAGDETQTLRLDRVRSIAEGNRGFALRSASVAVSSVEVFCGADISSPSGYFASHSFFAPPEEATDDPHSPPTGDGIFLFAAALLAASATGRALVRRRRA